MAVITQFIVVRDGVEKMTFASKKEADAYDKQLDIADNLMEFIEKAGVELDGAVAEELSLLLAKEAATVGQILKGGKPKKATTKVESKDEKTAPESKLESVKLVS